MSKDVNCTCNFHERKPGESPVVCPSCANQLLTEFLSQPRVIVSRAEKPIAQSKNLLGVNSHEKRN